MDYDPIEKFESDHMDEMILIFEMLEEHRDRTCLNILKRKNLSDFIEFVKDNSSLLTDYIHKKMDDNIMLEEDEKKYIDEDHEVIRFTKY